MASGIYNRLKYNLAKKLVDLSIDTIKVILLNNSHSFNADHNVNTDINTNEITGTGCGPAISRIDQRFETKRIAR